MSRVLEVARRLNKYYIENEDPAELARYGSYGHMDESILLDRIASIENEDFDDEDPAELERYGSCGHMDESILFDRIASYESEVFDDEF